MTRAPRTATLLFVLAGCASAPIPADRHTGPDGESDGAEPIALAGGHVEVDGEVSYRRGDRVDWNRIDLPAGVVADVSLTLRWDPDQAGDALGLVLYDADGAVLDEARGTRRARKHPRRQVRASGATGTLYVLIYALDRRDGGTTERSLHGPPDSFVAGPGPTRYQLEVDVDLHRIATAADFAAAWVQVGDPPPLAMVPTCQPGTPGFDAPVCAATREQLARDCRGDACAEFFPPCDYQNPDLQNPRCERDKIDWERICNEGRPGLRCNPPAPEPVP